MIRFPLRRKFFTRLLFFSAALLGMALLGYVYAFRIEPFWYKVEHVEIALDGLPPTFINFRIVCLSDIHQEPGGSLKHLERIVQRVNELEPDLICLLGDYVFSSADVITGLAPVLGELRARYGVYGVLGNHDLWTNAAVIQSGLEGQGIDLLVNEHIVVESGTGALVLVGLDDGWSGEPNLDRALAGSPSDAPVILLYHEPDFADQMSLSARVDLQLSGHSHGGQVRLPFVGAPFLPNFAHIYDQGSYQVEDLQLYVTRGIGVIPPAARFNCRPEITMITLVNPTS